MIDRKKDLARIHMLKKQLGLEDDEYRALLQGLTGKATSKDMTDQQRWAVIREMGKLAGEAPDPEPPPKQRREHYPRPAVQNSDKEPLMTKIEAILAELGLEWAYAHAMAKRMFGADLVQWLDAGSLHKLAAALVYHQRRQRAKKARAQG